MKKAVVFGIVLLHGFVLSALLAGPGAFFALRPHTGTNHHNNQHVPDPLSLAILAPTVTPTPLAPPATVETVPPAEHAAHPDNAHIDAVAPAASSNGELGASDPVIQEHPADAPRRHAEPAASEAPLLAPIALPTPTPDAWVTESSVSSATAAQETQTASANADAPSPVPAGATASASQAVHACHVTAPPAGFHSFYAKHCTAGGLPILASARVSDRALEQAWATITYMMDGIAHADEIRATMIGLGFRMGIIGVQEMTTDLPEHSSLNALFPHIDWNARTRAIGATTQIPLMSVSEENLLCLEQDRWRGQNLLVHEFAHAIKNLGLDYVNPGVHAALVQAYHQAQSQGLWANTYVISDVEEYWAEGVRIYFQLQPGGGAPGGQSYPANTRAELQSYDPALYGIISNIFGPKGALPGC